MDSTRGRKIRWLYIISICLWVFLIGAMELYQTNGLGWLLLAIPIIVFGIGIYNSDDLCTNVEEAMFEADFLSIGLLVVLPLLTWVTRDYQGDRKKFLSLVVVALILTMLSMIDIWVPFRQLYLVKHLKSIFQTTSLSLLMFALYTYYVGSGLTQLSPIPSKLNI